LTSAANVHGFSKMTFPRKRLLAPLLALACSPFREVASTQQLKVGQKVVAGEVRIIDGDLDQWVSGIFSSARLVFDYQLPVHGGRVVASVYDGRDAIGGEGIEPEARFDRNGGAFRVGVDNRDAYLISIRVRSTYVIANETRSFPLLVWIRPSSNRCDYVGTLLLHKKGRQLTIQTVDEYDRFVAAHPAWVQGCSLGKNLAITLTDEQLREYERRLVPRQPG
jgi:hypothetical protein